MAVSASYNEIEPCAAAWLCNLTAADRPDAMETTK